jgi:hypothetical protein
LFHSQKDEQASPDPPGNLVRNDHLRLGDALK